MLVDSTALDLTMRKKHRHTSRTSRIPTISAFAVMYISNGVDTFCLSNLSKSSIFTNRKNNCNSSDETCDNAFGSFIVNRAPWQRADNFIRRVNLTKMKYSLRYRSESHSFRYGLISPIFHWSRK